MARGHDCRLPLDCRLPVGRMVRSSLFAFRKLLARGFWNLARCFVQTPAFAWILALSGAG
jgi:hypothetical protein